MSHLWSRTQQPRDAAGPDGPVHGACKLDSVSDQPLSADGPAVTTRPAPVGWSVSGVVLAAALIAVCVAVGVSAALPGNTVLQLAGRDPGPLVTLGLPAVKGVVDLAGAVTVGWLIAAVLLAPPAVGGRFDTSGYRSAQAASLAATVWAVGALALVPLGYASAAGQSLGSSVGADQLINAVADYDIARAPLITALLAALVAVAARVVLRPATAAPVLVLAAVALLPIALAGHAAASSDHDYATDTMIYHLAGISVWIGGLVAFLGLARQRAAHLPLIARRYSTMALIAFVLVAVSGVGNALVRVPRMSDLVTTDYGRLVRAQGRAADRPRRFGYPAAPPLGGGHAARRPPAAAQAGGVRDRGDGRDHRSGRGAGPDRPAAAAADRADRHLDWCWATTCPEPPTPSTLVFGGRFDLILGTAALVFWPGSTPGVWSDCAAAGPSGRGCGRCPGSPAARCCCCPPRAGWPSTPTPSSATT